MSFASPVFLWLFLPLVLATYWVLPRSWRNGVLSLFSLTFYAYGAGGFVFVLLAMIAFNYVICLVLGDPEVDRRGRKRLLVIGIVVNLGVLVYWKYGGFLNQQVVELNHLLGGSAQPVIHVLLPLGISFFTFHHLSYLIDVYRRVKAPITNPLDFVTYIAMFPQLVAGPIVRFHEIADQLPERRDDRFADLAAGFPRFALGLFKKVVIADSIAPVANAAFAVDDGLTTASAWIGIVAFTLQIYFDFSGYSDMAIGLGRMFGFRLPENFARPYSATSITDFWRRWHMSLSRWFRDYVYIPLGGNQHGTARTYRNLTIVFVLTGLWHGAAWSFLIWGLYHGSLLVIERSRRGKRALLPAVLGRVRTLLLVMVGWVFFRAADLSAAMHYLASMARFDSSALNSEVDLALTTQRSVIMAAAVLVVLLPRGFVLGRTLDSSRRPVVSVARVAISVGGASVAGMLVLAGTFSPFLYFQF